MCFQKEKRLSLLHLFFQTGMKNVSRHYCHNWLLSQKEKQLNLPCWSGCRKNFTTIKIWPVYNMRKIYLKGQVLFVCHLMFSDLWNGPGIPCQAVPLCFSSCTVKSIHYCTVSSTLLILTQHLLQLPLSTTVCNSISRTRLQEASNLQ